MRGQYPSKIALGLYLACAILVAFAAADEGSGENSTLPTDFFEQIDDCGECGHERYVDKIRKFSCAMAKDDMVGYYFE